MAKVHGKVTVFKLDDLSGAIQDISAKLDSVAYNPGSDRPETQTFGQGARRREILGLRRASFSLAGFYTETSAKIHGKNSHASPTPILDAKTRGDDCELAVRLLEDAVVRSLAADRIYIPALHLAQSGSALPNALAERLVDGVFRVPIRPRERCR